MTPEDTAEKVRDYLGARFNEITDYSDLAGFEVDLNNLITLIDTQNAEIQDLTVQLIGAREDLS